MIHSLASSQRLVTGYNHNIPYDGVVYHVQTEFFGTDPSRVETHVFTDGRVVGSHRTEVNVDDGSTTDAQVVHVMKAQQKEMIRRLISGRLTGAPGSATGKVAPASGSRRAAAPTDSSAGDDRGTAESSPSAAAYPTDFDPEHSVANLELRRSLIRFLRAVRPDQPPEEDEVVSRLRSVVTTTAVILGKHVYDNSRHDELADLLILRSEGLDYLRSPDEAPEGKGRKLWNGFAKISRRFGRLNQRRELVAHDREVWDRVLRRLAELEDDAKVEKEVLDSLKSSWGRDLELDRLLEFPVGLTVGGLRDEVERARGELPSRETAEGCT